MAAELMCGIWADSKDNFTNTIPMALENLKLAAQAIAKACSEAERQSVNKDPKTLEVILRSMLEKNEYSQEMLDNSAFLTDLYHKKHRLLVEEFTSRNKESTLRMFSEMKGYANPNHAIKRTVVALLVYLDILPSEIEMGPDLPKQVDTNEELWTLARKAVQLYPHHPEYIIKLLANSVSDFFSQNQKMLLSDPATAQQDEAAKEVQQSAMFSTIDQLLEGMTVEEVKNASAPMGDMFEFVTNAVQTVKLSRKVGQVMDAMEDAGSQGKSRQASGSQFLTQDVTEEEA
uniref:Uncharacterized protein n=1 Tax=Pyramimonas obovata TaxID=1411642 RepID=A0A7S0WPF9_9CHLO